MRSTAPVFVTLLVLAGCNPDRSMAGSANGVPEDLALAEVSEPDVFTPPDVRPDLRQEVRDEIVPDVEAPPDARPPTEGCFPVGFEMDCSDPQWQVPLDFAGVGDPCSGELIYRGAGEHIAYGTRDNPGMLTLREDTGGFWLESRGVNPPTGVLCTAFVRCSGASLLASFEGPGFGAAYLADGERTAVIGTIWGAHRTMSAGVVESGRVTRAWATGDSTSWLFLAERDRQVTRWRDITADGPGEHTGIVGVLAGAGTGYAGVASHRYYALGMAFDGLVERTLFDSRSWDGPISRAWPVSGLGGVAAVVESSLEGELSTVGDAHVTLAIAVLPTHQVAVSADLRQLLIARLSVDGALEFALYEPEVDLLQTWRRLADLDGEALLLGVQVEEQPVAPSTFALTYTVGSGSETEVFVSRPLDVRCN